MKVIHYINRLLLVTEVVDKNSFLSSHTIILNHEDCQQLVHLDHHCLDEMQQWCVQHGIDGLVVDYQFEYIDSVIPFARLPSATLHRLFGQSVFHYERVIHNSDGSSLDLDMTKLEAMLDKKIAKFERLFLDDLK